MTVTTHPLQLDKICPKVRENHKCPICWICIFWFGFGWSTPPHLNDKKPWLSELQSFLERKKKLKTISTQMHTHPYQFWRSSTSLNVIKNFKRRTWRGRACFFLCLQPLRLRGWGKSHLASQTVSFMPRVLLSLMERERARGNQWMEAVLK